MKHVKITWKDLNGHVSEIVRQIYEAKWRPDYIVGITRGGNVAATMLSHYLGVRMHTLNVALRDINDPGPESNTWMAQDAFGYNPPSHREDDKDVHSAWLRKKILIVDDINDSGATFDWIKKDWQASVASQHEAWGHVWHENVRFATIVHKVESKQPTDFKSLEIEQKDNYWFVFPWEEWWK